MKILFVAVFTPNSTNVYQSRGFKDLGHKVYEYDYRVKVRQFGSVQKRDDDLIQTCQQFKPDFVLFSKCNQMHYRVIDECNKIAKTGLWYMDATNNFDMELIDKIKRSTVAIFGIPGMVKHSLPYNQNSCFIDQCPDEKINFMIPDSEYKYDVTFIGDIGNVSTHSDRRKYKNAINFNHFNNAYGLEHTRVVNQSKINLNFSHTDGTGASVRIYKILASGAFLMTTPWVEEFMNKSFEPGEDFVTFNSVTELKEKVDFYLKNDEERDRIRMNGYKKVQNYFPKQWAQKILDEL